MAIRIESLSSDNSHPVISTAKIEVASHRYHPQNQVDFEVLPEMAQIYGGAIASTLPRSHTFPQAETGSISSVSSSRWSNSLQTMLDRPPATFPSQLVAGGVVFCAAFATWAAVGQVDEVGHGSGRLVPQGEPYKIHPVVPGKVARLMVREGQTVKAGQPIAELENTIAMTRIQALHQEYQNYEKELQQTESLIDKTQLEAQSRSAIADAEIRAQEATITQAEAKITGQNTSIVQANDRASISQKLLSELQSDADAHKERISRWKELVEAGALARDQLFQAQQQFNDRQRSITQQQGDIQLTLTEAKRLRSDLQQAIAESQRMQAELSQRYAQRHSTRIQAQQTIQQLLVQRIQLISKMQQNQKQQETAKAELNELTLRAPVDGVVLALNVRNSGEVVQAGQTIAELASQKAPLILATALATKEAGFIKVGDKVQVKFDAYPYQDYGIMTGKVLSISPDVKVDERQGAFYRVDIALDRRSISPNIELKSGQTATAEIIIRRRHIADMLLDPIRQLQKSNLNL
jgi:multidrug efflux pump subunit AcrA (membrane-fusion protein)